MILGFLFFIQTFLKHCKALSTEKYRRYINTVIIIILLLLLLKFELTMAIGRGPNIVIFSMVDKTKLLQKLSKDEKVPTSGITNLPPC